MEWGLHIRPKPGEAVYMCTHVCPCAHEALHVPQLHYRELRAGGENEHTTGSHGFFGAMCWPWHFALIAHETIR